MAKYGSSSASVFLVNGYDFIANALQGIAWKEEAKTEMTHGLGSSAEQVTPIGIKKYTLTQSGAFFDDTANTMHDRLKAGATDSRIVCFAVAGNSVSAPFVGCLGAFTVGYEVLAQNEALTKANATYAISGLSYWGQIVQPWATKTGDWNTKTLGTTVDYAADPSQVVIPITSNSIANPTVVTTAVAHGLTTGQVVLISGVSTSSPTINGQQTVTVVSPTTFTVAVNVTVAGTGGSLVRCSTVNGGVGFQQVSAFSGFTGYVGKIQDSADDVTYADLATFANVTSGPTAETVTVTGTVDRYLSHDGNITGSGSITAFSGFART
jgi:hypothetical protein